MLLALDIGNTNITIGLFREDRLLGTWRLSTARERSADEYGPLILGLLKTAGLDPAEVTDLVVASVVPPAVAPIREMARRYFAVEPLLVEPGVRTGIPILTDNPQEVGADRIANAASAFARHGGPTVVVDLGTAVTFDAISAKGEYLGGVIAPGLGIAAEALFARTARLPRVELRRPAQVIGRNTIASVQSGLIFGYAALIDGIVARLTTELAPPDGEGVKVIGTGGHSDAVAEETRSIQVVESDLTLDGLRRIWSRNHGGRAR